MNSDTATMPPSRSGSLAPGACIGRLRIERTIGSGGMGEVYCAQHLDLGKSFAIKLIKDESGSFAALYAQLRREARTLAALSHPNIVAVTDFGFHGRQPYLVMEFAEGGSLADFARQQGGRLAADECRRLLIGALTGLAHAHATGLVHGDFKPANLLLFAHGIVKVADFGIALSLRSRFPARPQHRRSGDLDDGMTESPAAFPTVPGGTPIFMAPECKAGMSPSMQSDIWSVGVTAFLLLTGRVPEGVWAPPAHAAPGLDPRWDQFLARCLEFDPARRYRDAGEALEGLTGHWQTEEPSPPVSDPPKLGSAPAVPAAARRPFPTTVVAIALALALAVAWAAWHLASSQKEGRPTYRPDSGPARETKPLLPRSFGMTPIRGGLR